MMVLNPEHLEVGTHKDNVADMYRAGRQPDWRGENNPKSRFTNADVIEMRQWYELGYTQQNIADAFDTTQPVVSEIINRKVWSHL